MVARIAGECRVDGRLPLRVCNGILYAYECQEPHALPHAWAGNELRALLVGRGMGEGRGGGAHADWFQVGGGSSVQELEQELKREQLW